MARHKEKKGGYLFPRGLVAPAEKLLRMIFPFVEEKLGQIQKLQGDGIYRLTARGFLGLLKNLCTVILQDAAGLQLLGRTHLLFNLNVFQSMEFAAFREKVKVATKSAEEPVNTMDILGEELN
jgi:hypothetical protein